ncbi:DUF952 domain-containing protein, partial [Rhizobium ruizarguesonis]
MDGDASFRQSPRDQGTAYREAMMTRTPTLYKSVTETLWQQARQTGTVHGAGID